MGLDMKIDYQVVHLDTVLEYFAKGFSLPDGRQIFKVEAFTDTVKGRVVFEITSIAGTAKPQPRED